MPSGGRIQSVQCRNYSDDEKNSSRRSSATNISQRPPIPSIIRNRSQSLDILLDERLDEPNASIGKPKTASVSEDASEQSNQAKKEKSNTKNKLNEQNNDNEISQKREEYQHSREPSPQKSIIGGVNTRLNQSETNSIGSSTSLVNCGQNSNESSFNPDDTKSSRSTSSGAQYSMGSESSDTKRNLLNKYVKKVKSLIKK